MEQIALEISGDSLSLKAFKSGADIYRTEIRRQVCLYRGVNGLWTVS